MPVVCDGLGRLTERRQRGLGRPSVPCRSALEALKGENTAQASLIAELRIGLDQSRAEVAEARRASAGRGDDARKAKGRWARLRGAWRGE